jgi:predicted phage-related endonuclease
MFGMTVDHQERRRTFIGGSDARVLMSTDEAAVVRLWQEKRGEAEPPDLFRNLLVQLGLLTEELNRRWFEQETGRRVSCVQEHRRSPRVPWMGATLDGWVADEGAVFEAKFMLPWSFAEDAAADKHRAQLQHNMLVTGARRAYLSILTGGAKWVLVEMEADPLYQTVLLQVERIFWRCVQTGERPKPFADEVPLTRTTRTRVVDMAASNAWAEHAAVYRRTHLAHTLHEIARSELKALVPGDAREAFGHGVRARRSRTGAVTLSPVTMEGAHVPLQ